MFKDKRFKYILIFSFILFTLSFSFGYLIMDNNIKKEENNISAREPIDKIDNKEYIQIVQEENIITPSTILEERVHYKVCDDIPTVEKRVPDEFVNMTRDELVGYLENNSPQVRLVSFSTERIILWSEKDQLCTNHFVIGEEDGKIAIFKIDEKGERVLDKVFSEYPINLLHPIDQDKLREGIRVDNEEDLSDIIENYIS
jgi:hypothetical protein